MSHTYVYRAYKIKGSVDSIREGLTRSLLAGGYIQTGDDDNITFFHYPSITFSSRQPLTCVSRLSLEVMEKQVFEKNLKINGGVLIKIGANFAKIRYFNIIIMAIVCGVLPAVLGYIKNGIPDIPPMSYLGIPIGFMVHYHVRGRVFRAFRHLIVNVEATCKVQSKSNKENQ